MPSDEIKRSLRVSWKEGIPASAMLAIVDYYLIPYGLFLGATTRGIAWLVSLPHLLGSLSLLGAAEAVRWAGSRLRFVVGMSALQAALLLPAAALAAVAFPRRVLALTALAVAFRVLMSMIGAAWGSLMSEYLPPERRGRYFGWRSQICGIAGLAGVALGGGLLFSFSRTSEATGFFLLFLGAAALRFVSAAMLARMVDLPVGRAPGSDFTFVMFLRRMRQSNFVKFVLYVAGITFATHMAAPYFSVYMLKGLGMNYLQYMWVHLAAVVGMGLAFPLWGRHADWVGNAQVLRTAGWIVPMIPFLWLVSPSPVYLFGVEFFAGFIWGGFNLCSLNFVYDAVTPEKRVRCLGYFNLVNGIALFLGALLGGFLADRLPPIQGHRLLTLFALSGILRLAANGILSGRFQEVRASAKPVSSRQLFFSVVGIRPLVGRDTE